MPKIRSFYKVIPLAAFLFTCQPSYAQNFNNGGFGNFFPPPNGTIGDGSYNNLPPPDGSFQPNFQPINNNYFYLPPGPGTNIVVPQPTPALFNNNINTMPAGNMSINRNITPMLPNYQHLLSNTVKTQSGVDTVLVQVSSNKSQMIMFTSANQVFTGTRGRKLTGKAGTTISTNKDLVVLFSGRLKAESGKNSTTIDAPKCKIQLSPDASVIVDSQPGKPIRIMALAAGAERTVSVAPLADGASAIELQPGEELIIGDSQLSEEDLIPADGLVRTVLAGGIQKQTYSIARTKFSLADFNAQESSPSKAVRLASSRWSADSKAKPEATRAHYSKKMLSNQTGNVHLYVSDDAAVSVQADGHIVLERGNAFLSPNTAVSVISKHAEVLLQPHSLVLIEEGAGFMRLKAFTGPDHTKVKVEDQTIQMLPGEELLLSEGIPGASELTPTDGVGRRMRYSLPRKQSGAMVVNDFSIPLTLAHKNIRTMVKDPENGGLYNRVLKTAVIVEMVTKGRGRYTVSTNPEMISDASRR